MQRYVAFLRSINVGGRRVTGKKLVEIFSNLGFVDPANFLASGNVVFDAEPSADLTTRIEEGLSTSLGYEVPVLLRTAQKVQAIARFQPFTKTQLSQSKGKTQVSILLAPPTADQVSQILKTATSDDLLAFDTSELHWLPSGGTSDSRLDTASIERILGSQTRRTLNTVQRLSRKFL